MTSQHLPRLVVLVAQGDRAVAERAYGDADVSGRVPATTKTRFQIGSITKQFTAACILQLVDAHRIALDDALGTYVPSYANASAVTVRQLLEQTTGIPDYLNSLHSADDAGKPIAFADLIARIAARPLAFPPGTKWQYSNINYTLLGRIVELVSHESYERYVREHIFAPAHMTRSGFIGDGRDPAATARGYVSAQAATSLAPWLDETWAFAAGGIISTAVDLLAWNNALLSGTIVPAADVTLMRTSAILRDGTPTGYGFGWIMDGTAAHPRIWHNGGTFGFSASNVTYPHDNQTIVVLTNLGYAAPITIATAIFAQLHPDDAIAAATPAPNEDAAITARAREWFRRFETGDIDAAQLNATMRAGLTAETVATIKTQFSPLGEPTRFVNTGSAAAPGNLVVYTYAATVAGGTSLRITMTLDAEGKIAGYFVKPA